MGKLGKIIVATGFEKLTKVHEIAQSGHTGYGPQTHVCLYPFDLYFDPYHTKSFYHRLHSSKIFLEPSFHVM